MFYQAVLINAPSLPESQKHRRIRSNPMRHFSFRNNSAARTVKKYTGSRSINRIDYDLRYACLENFL